VKEDDAMALSWKRSLGVGLFQCLAVVPGVSRSGATIVGSMLMGVEKRAAAEFSFFLAIPIMAGAFVVDAVKNRHELMSVKSEIPLIAIGFVVAFIVALLVVRWFVGLVGRTGFSPFGWYRIAVGALALVFLLK
jgi:undecaprenyl-diphosphatase